MIIDPLIDSYKQSSQTRVGTKNNPDSVTPTDVAGCDQDLAEIVRIVGNAVNNFDLLGNTLPPLNSAGVDDDIYIQGGTTLRFYKKISGVWTLKVSVPLGVTIQDGNINLQPRVSGFTITVPPGQWGINNQIYTKAAQDQFTINAADANLDRIDAVFAKTDSTVEYVAGTASSNPDTTKPTTPSNQVIVTYVYVPSVASGGLPYINDSNSSPAVNPLVLTGGTTTPTGGNDGDVYIQNDGSVVTFYQKVTGTWTAIQNFSIGGGGDVTAAGDNFFTGNNTFSEIIDANISGNASTASFASTAGTADHAGTSDQAAQVDTISGKIEEGTNITITGFGTDADPYIISSSGGGGGAVTSVNGQTGVVVLGAEDVLTAENLGEFMDVTLPTKITPVGADSILARDSVTNEAVEINYSSFQAPLTFDSTPTAASTNPVTSAGVKTALDTKLTGTLAADADLQTQTTPTEDNKIVSRHGLIFFWNWLKTQTVEWTNSFRATRFGAGIAAAASAFITVAASTSSVASFLVTFGASYTGTASGSVWGETTGFRLRIFRNGIADDFVFAGANSVLAGAGTAIMNIASDGSLIRGATIEEAFETDPDVITAITGASYIAGYSAITPSGGKIFYQGDEYFDSSNKYWYRAVANNEVIRVIPS